MIAKASSITHGATALAYNTGKEKSVLLVVHGFEDVPEPFPDEPVAEFSGTADLWADMVMHQKLSRAVRPERRRVTRNALRFEISPTNEDTRDWKFRDWKQLAREFLREVDGINPKTVCPKSRGRYTNLCNSQYVVSLHSDSKSGILHLHILVNRIDLDGDVNDDSMIGLRAKAAARAITQRRGWKTADERRLENIDELKKACHDVLRAMKDGFGWGEYGESLKKRGYELQLRRDSANAVVGYWIKKGNSVYKASDIDKALTAKHIGETWRKAHAAPQVSGRQTGQTSVTKTGQPEAVRKPASSAPPAGHRPEGPVQPNPVPVSQSARGTSGSGRTQPVMRKVVPHHIECGVRTWDLKIPGECWHAMKDVLRDCGDVIDLKDENVVTSAINAAVLLFCGLVNGATYVSTSCGGGGSTESDWGRKKEEEELEWMRRCARQAALMCRPAPRRMGRRR